MLEVLVQCLYCRAGIRAVCWRYCNLCQVSTQGRVSSWFWYCVFFRERR